MYNYCVENASLHFLKLYIQLVIKLILEQRQYFHNVIGKILNKVQRSAAGFYGVKRCHGNDINLKCQEVMP